MTCTLLTACSLGDPEPVRGVRTSVPRGKVEPGRGFEPLTCALRVRCSGRLSYPGEASDQATRALWEFGSRRRNFLAQAVTAVRRTRRASSMSDSLGLRTISTH